MLRIKCKIILLALLLLASQAQANPFILDQNLPHSGQALGPYLQFFKSNLDDPRSLASDTPYIQMNRTNPNFGYTKDSYWARLDIVNKTEPGHYVIDYNGLVASMEMLDPNGQSHEFGLYIPRLQGEPLSRFPLTVVYIKEGINTFYFRNHSNSKQFPLRFYRVEGYQEQQALDVLIFTLCSGLLIGIFAYYLLTWFVIRNADVAFYMAYALFGALFTIFFSGIGRIFLPDLSELLVPYFLVFSSLTAFFAIAFIIRFLNLKKRQPTVAKMFWAGIVLQCAIIITLVADNYMLAMKMAQFTALYWLLAVYAGAKASWSGYRPAVWFTCGWISMVCAFILVFASGWGLVDSPLLQNSLFLGTTVEMLFMSLSVSEKLKEKERRLARRLLELNTSLEVKVEERTRDIASYLTNIKQGILSIRLNNQHRLEVEEHHSIHLLEMLQTSHQAMALSDPNISVLSQLNLSEDQKFICQTILETSLGESVIQWESNEDKLPRESIILHSQRLVEIEWNPVVDDDHCLQKVLLSIKDVTEIRGLKQKALQEAKTGTTIALLAAVRRDIASKFFEMASSLIRDNRELIEILSKRLWKEGEVQRFYRNIHTLKGSARGFQMSDLVDVLHQTETLLAQKDIAQIPEVHDHIVKVLDFYQNINDVILGRSRARYEYIELARSEIDSLLQEFPNKDLMSRKIRKKLRLLTAHTLQRTLAAEFAKIPALAQSLGKEVPLVSIENDEFHLDESIEQSIRSVFIHLLRNSLDHGLEGPKERVQIGKTPHGRILVRVASASPDQVEIIYQDDGRGLNLKRIRQNAFERKLYQPAQTASDIEVAHLIFTPEFSTASEVTDISGRGVGMDAVKAYLNQLGGTISIEFLDQKEGADFRHFAFKMLLKAQYFHVLSA
ncbi:MAG: 7TM diverse intracellular signaling domain-containing protein [Oligoflexus sp.]